ncbi:hypothetical protein G5B38_16555 [Pseudohalocynthiibacter aestuariivivens]|nr:hypothetical protein [Pseudohalocynthiibacter aestuariivivens]QIE47003.1 hypothetical protein G5B38_16555 [Pseudohalocynthiibacter aestuariivivens]
MPTMTDYESLRVDDSKLRPGLRLDTLMESRLPELSDAEIDEVIAQTLNEQKDEERAAASAAVTQAVARAEAPPLRRAATTASAKRGRGVPVEQTHAAFEEIDPPRDTGRPRAVRKGWLGRVLIAASAIAVFYTWPWIVPTLIIGAIWLALIAFIFVGAERIAAAMLWFYRWLDDRAPRRAERLRAGADGLAIRLDALFDRLPGRWTEGLYMPDFSREALLDDSNDEGPDPFDRLAAQARHG